MSRSKKAVVDLVLAVAVAAATVARLRPTPLDTRSNGAYRLDNGRLVFIRA